MIAFKIFTYLLIYIICTTIFLFIAKCMYRHHMLTNYLKRDVVYIIILWPISFSGFLMFSIIAIPAILIDKGVDWITKKL